jgi:hypothetical protein
MFKFRNAAILAAVVGLTLISTQAYAKNDPVSPGTTRLQIVSTPNENQPFPSRNFLISVSASAPTDMWAVGASAIHYDGQSWTAFPAPDMTGTANNLLNGVADVSPDDVWAVGYINLQMFGEFEAPIVEHFDGTSWTISSSPQFPPPNIGALYAVTAISANDIWAGGFLFDDPNNMPLLEHFDGNSWTQFEASAIDCIVYGLSAHASNDVWAVGVTLGGTTYSLHYNGTTWTAVSSPNGCCGYNSLNGVVALAPDNVWAAGWYSQNPNDTRPQLTLIEHWNGTEWQIVPSPNFGQPGKYSSRFRGIFAGPSGKLLAVGENTSIATDDSTTLAEYWNGTEWKIIPTPNIKYNNILNAQLEAGIAIPGGDIWMVGSDNVFATLVMQSVQQPK